MLRFIISPWILSAWLCTRVVRKYVECDWVVEPRSCQCSNSISTSGELDSDKNLTLSPRSIRQKYLTFRLLATLQSTPWPTSTRRGRQSRSNNRLFGGGAQKARTLRCACRIFSDDEGPEETAQLCALHQLWPWRRARDGGAQEGCRARRRNGVRALRQVEDNYAREKIVLEY
jgi:hypothetical protein